MYLRSKVVDRKLLEDMTNDKMSRVEVEELIAQLEQRSFMINLGSQ